jgi:hypothetical protein
VLSCTLRTAIHCFSSDLAVVDRLRRRSYSANSCFFVHTIVSYAVFSFC